MKLDFEMTSNAADWHTMYAGLGVTFVGGSLAVDLGNHYIMGAVTMRFDPAFAPSGIHFRGDAAGPDNYLYTFRDADVPFEPVMFESGSWTPTGKIPGWYPTMMFDGFVHTEGVVNRVDFTTTLLDDIDLPGLQSAHIPEPSSLALILAATAAIAFARSISHSGARHG
jgi:hypothetical protein